MLGIQNISHMNRLTHILFVLILSLFVAGNSVSAQNWSDGEITAANTAATCPFLSQVEKDVVLYNNLARMYPKKFVAVELRELQETSYVLSLKRDMNNLRPLSALTVNATVTNLAKCWAEESGSRGITGHNRINCDTYYIGGSGGENCSYGKKTGRDIIVQLLVDENVASLGHRKNCLNPEFRSVGVGFATHTKWNYCCVMDFTSLEGVSYMPGSGCASAPSVSHNQQTTVTPRQTSDQDSDYQQKQYSTMSSKGKTDGNFLSHYYDYSGKSSLSIFSAGYTYSLVDGRHLVNASLLDFRIRMFGMSPLAAEFSVSPLDARVAYKPSVRLHIPVIKWIAVTPYVGTAVDVSYLGTLLIRGYDYQKSRDFYVSLITGVSLFVTAARNVPFEVKVEYRYPLVTPTTGVFNPHGVYLGAQIYFSRVFA